MNEGSLHSLSPTIRGDGSECRYCFSCHKGCYRYYNKPNRRWIYVIVPCHCCRPAEFRLMAKEKYPSLEYSERWVNLSVETQLAMPTATDYQP